jgi:hypothetical protein
MTSRLVAPILFLVTGLVTGYTTFYRMMWAIWGAPIAFVMYVAMCGSGLLVVAIVVTAYSVRRCFIPKRTNGS